jgi:putative thioredoxin
MSELTPAVGRDTFEAEVLGPSATMPVLVDFWADWCGPCKMLAPTLERLAADYAGRARIVKVDTEAERELAAYFGIRSLPTVRVFRHGRPVEDAVGVQPESALRELIERHLERPSDRVLAEAAGLMSNDQPEQAVLLLEALLREEPDHVPAQVLLIEALTRAGRTDEAEARLATLPVQALEAPQLAAVEAGLHFAKLVKAAPSEEALRTRVAADPGDLEAQHQLAAREITGGRGEAALDRLVTAMQRDRRFGDDLARRSLLHAFALLGDQEDMVHHYRRRMMALMH